MVKWFGITICITKVKRSYYVYTAVANNGKALIFAAEKVLNERSIVFKACEKDGFNLRLLPSQWLEDKDVVLAAVSQNGESLKYAPSLCHDDEVAICALKSYHRAWLAIDPSLKNKADFIDQALAINGLIWQWLLPEQKTEDRYHIALRSHPMLYPWAERDHTKQDIKVLNHQLRTPVYFDHWFRMKHQNYGGVPLCVLEDMMDNITFESYVLGYIQYHMKKDSNLSAPTSDLKKQYLEYMQTALLGRVMVKDIWCHMMSFISQKDTHKLTPVLEWSVFKRQSGKKNLEKDSVSIVSRHQVLVNTIKRLIMPCGHNSYLNIVLDRHHLAL